MIRLLIAAATATIMSLVGTKFVIEFLVRNRIGQPIRDDGPEGHATKAGTPTMGGVAIVGGAVFGYMVSDLYNGIYTRTGIFVMLAIIGGGAVGLMDDWIKVVRERNLGLSSRAKMLGLLVVAVGFGVLMVQFTNVHTEISFTRWDSIGLDLGKILWVVWAVALIAGSSNAVNLTDGLDGLAAGSAIISFAAFVLIGFWKFSNADLVDGGEQFYDVTHALDLAVVAAAMLGGCIGFLYWNAAPAQIFMGDTGSLAIGTGLAALALATNTHLLLPIIGGLFVIETVSVILQVGRFQLTGKRFFRMAPIHHHFELGGWHETWVIIRFWMFHALCVAFGLGLFYADWIPVGS
ncbi:MAG: phospho-N-acetylmuramoyl-pentapeptide-transferase [Acidimicrobiales bacterium]|nr:phospho-N-acetylmuramoyl-pentapeptide-transferase [Acidimicrobiales bacterium]